jgi:aminopeptidase N
MDGAASATASPPRVRLADYRPPPLLIDRIDLDFRLDPGTTRVRSRLSVRHNGAPAPTLRLDGIGLKLLWIAVDGRRLEATEFTLDDTGITLGPTPREFTLESEVEISPAANAGLVGLYQSGGLLCTQCEPEGFRRITWFLDRPDVLARYTVRLEADSAAYPYLLSNGNSVSSGCEGGRHYVVWEDPFPKPSYLFALVAGDFDVLERRFPRMGGRVAALRMYVAHGEAARAAYAMDALERAVRWDERTYGRELDLDAFMVVAVRDFNFGAMENKGLNIFSSSCILADPHTATDEDYERVERLIAHEYFHNWSGNRVTCRDWFQLCVKEGLTVFREQQFCIELRGAAARIRQVRVLRTRQFTEDAGALVHAVRPASFQMIENFYTATVYEKGAELVRLLGTLLGEDALRKGITEYFARCDGTAATMEDFIGCFELSSQDRAEFMLWYTQAGTPELVVRTDYDRGSGTLLLHFAQYPQTTPDEPVKRCLPIPIKIGMLDEDGRQQSFVIQGSPQERLDTTFLMRGSTKILKLTHVECPPVLSLARGFSTPVRKRVVEPPDHAFVRLIADPDPFDRWDAAQALATRFIIQRLHGACDVGAEQRFGEALAAGVRQESLASALRAELLTLPGESELGLVAQPLDPAQLHEVRQGLLETIAAVLRDPCEEIYEQHRHRRPYSPDFSEAGPRALRNAALQILAVGDGRGAAERARAHYFHADNLTDRLCGLQALACCDEAGFLEAIAHFHAQWRHEPLALDKWFAIQARTVRPQALSRIVTLAGHADFERRNPDRLRALVETLALENPAAFHAPDGGGYVFVADQILAVDAFNPIVAARLMDCFAAWRRCVRPLAEHMQTQLQRMAHSPGVSPNVVERATTALASIQTTAENAT